MTSAAPANENPQPLFARLWRYQAERFPLFKHGLLILVFSGGEALYGARLRDLPPDWPAVAVAALVCFGLFFQLRVADEHKDLADDTRYRPERPVPRGLIRLAELRTLALAVAVLQLALTAAFHWPLVFVLLGVWGWMALMTAEFFAPAWLKRRPILYLVSHMLVMPLIALYAIAAGARGITPDVSLGLVAFLALAFANGVVLEVGRKSWGPLDERLGVETYSKLWGVRGAARTVAAVGLAATLTALLAQAAIGGGSWRPALVIGFMLLGAAAWAYAQHPDRRTAKALEASAGLFVLAVYLGVAWLPVLERLWTA